MSFDGFKSVINEGDTAILYLSANQFFPVRASTKILSKKGVQVDNVIQTPFGGLRCAELIGKHFGSKINLSKGWAYVLQPTPDLWTQALPHRTQIIYTPDISMIILQLELKPNSVVVESGTGSGSLSHGIIKTIKPHGHLHTFDFHEARVAVARDEFTEHGLGGYVTVECRDVCANGFGESLKGKADAVFLDLPHPWLAVPHAAETIRPEGGRICSFSPCIEQVQKSCAALSAAGFDEVETVEVLQTQFSVTRKTLFWPDLSLMRTKKEETDEGKAQRGAVRSLSAVPPNTQAGHTGFLTFATLPPVWCRMN